MKSICILLMAFTLSALSVNAQTAEKKMEERAKMMHETLKSSDQMVHEAYVKENFAKNLLEKYEMSRHTGMFKMINRDFSDSKIVSLKFPDDNKVFMAIERNSDKHRVTFDLSFDPKDDYKINGLSIEAGEL